MFPMMKTAFLLVCPTFFSCGHIFNTASQSGLKAKEPQALAAALLSNYRVPAPARVNEARVSRSPQMIYRRGTVASGAMFVGAAALFPSYAHAGIDATAAVAETNTANVEVETAAKSTFSNFEMAGNDTDGSIAAAGLLAAVGSIAASVPFFFKEAERQITEVPSTQPDEASLRRLFQFLDRSGKDVVSKRDVIFALKKHASVRVVFGLPVGRADDDAVARIDTIQDAFESSSSLGEAEPIFEIIAAAGGSAERLTWAGFLSYCQQDRVRERLHEAVSFLPRELGARFHATSEWQIVPEGAVCEEGLEYDVNVAGGFTRARLRVKSEAKGKAEEEDTNAAREACPFKVGQRVKATHSFMTNSEGPVRLGKSEMGTVLRIDEDGDLLIDFDVHDDSQWIFSDNFGHLE